MRNINDPDQTRELPASPVSRRDFLRYTGAAAALVGVESLAPAYARAQPLVGSVRPLPPQAPGATRETDLLIREAGIRVGSRRATAMSINDTVPGPLLRFREGDDAVLRVRNALGEDTSIHWHGILLPPEMDGVPGLSFDGIQPGETFEYRFPIKQYGTYWYHSHSGFQEQKGIFGPLVIDPADPEPFQYDRDYVVMLSDWTFEDPARVLDKLRKDPGYYNYRRRTVGDFFRDVARDGLGETLRERWEWASMRMDPTDIADITGATYTFLMNGMAPVSNWTGLFQPGERVRLRFINAAASTYFDIRIPGLEMTVVQASGQHVQPVKTDEFRIALAETFDVIVEPKEDRAYTIFAETMDRSGFARGTLAPRAGMSAAIPARRRPPLLTMKDMGMDHGSMGGMNHGSMPGMSQSGMEGMNHGSASAAPAAPGAGAHTGHDMGGSTPPAAGAGAHGGHDMGAMNMGGGSEMAGHSMAGMAAGAKLRAPGTLPEMVEHDPKNTHGVGNAAVPMMTQSRLSEPGVGLGEDGRRVLVYTDLRGLKPSPLFGPPTREIELHLTGNMERYIWGVAGGSFDNDEPIRLNYGERVRLTLVNDTMMNHPMHLHGMWLQLENGAGEMIPLVHTVNVKPAERVSLLVMADAPGRWAFHCHILYHMDVGMFRVFEVLPPPIVGERA